MREKIVAYLVIALLALGIGTFVCFEIAVDIVSATQQPYIICGHVWNEEKQLAEGVEVTVINLRSNETQMFITNEKGEFLIECLNFKQEYQNGDQLLISCIYDSVEVAVDTQYAGIQCPINKPVGVPVEPIVAGTVLVTVASGLYYYIKRKKKKVIKDKKQMEGIEEKMDEKKEESEEVKKVKIELPEGTRRFILALILLLTVAITSIRGLEAPQWLVQIVGIVIAFFFGAHSKIK